MTLREQIARRLMDRYKEGYGKSWELTFDVMADEVIRLMEWARRQNLQAFKPGVVEYVDPVLTLPPEDWRAS